MNNLCLASLASALALLACGCGSTAPAPTSDRAAIDKQTEITKSLLLAAEPFEALAETAFIAGPSELDKSIDTANSAVRRLTAMVPADLSERLQRRLSEIRRARKSDQKADLAIASIEGFREIVSSIPDAQAVPVNVSLLDYAGFRVDADAQANPPRWADMAVALAFAREQWAGIAKAPQLSLLRSRFEGVLAAMETALQVRDAAAASAAARSELSLVDELEAAFAKLRS